MGMEKLKKILMAVDPFVDELKPNPPSLTELRTWLRNSNARLEVVHVAAVGSARDRVFDSATVAEHFTKKYAEELGFEPEQARVILEKTSSHRQAVHALIQHARKTGAGMIVLTSYGRRIIGRLVLGSFADTLLAESPVPVLFLGSDPEQQHWSNTVLFPTDLSPPSRAAFDLYLEQFEATKPHTILFHLDTVPSLLASPLSTIELGEMLVDRHEKYVNEEANRWLEHAHAKGYSAVFNFERHSENLTRAILEVAHREQVGLIALASTAHSARLRSVWSVSSSIFYQHRFPVWVCGPEAVREEHPILESATRAGDGDAHSRSPLKDIWSA